MEEKDVKAAIERPNPLLAVQVIVRGLKCDAPGCGYIDPTVELSRRGVLGNVNQPCPRCGANLLTEADARTILMHMRLVRIANVVLFPIMLLTYPFKRLKWKRWVKCRVTMNGSGAVHYSDLEDLEGL